MHSTQPVSVIVAPWQSCAQQVCLCIPEERESIKRCRFLAHSALDLDFFGSMTMLLVEGQDLGLVRAMPQFYASACREVISAPTPARAPSHDVLRLVVAGR